MGFDFDMSAEDIKVFLDEAEEQLQTMEVGILRLEKEAENPEHLQEVFRAAHTLKGSSATLGHKKMAEVTHAMENVLDKLRKGRLALRREVVDALFGCLDVLQAFKEEIATGQESHVTTHAILGKLALVDSATPSSPIEARIAISPVEDALLRHDIPSLSPLEEQKARAGELRGQRLYWSVVKLDKNSPMPAVRAFQVLLSVGDLGELVRSWPTQEEVEEDKVGDDLKLLFLTNSEQSVIQGTLGGVPEVEIISLSAVDEKTPRRSTEHAPEAATALIEEPTQAFDGPDMAGGAPGTSIVKSAGKSSARTVRVDVDVLDNLMSLVGELVIDRTRLQQVLTTWGSNHDGEEIVQVMNGTLAHIGRMTSDLQDEIQRARMLSVDNLFRKFPRMVREVAQKVGKEIEFVVLGEETELDRSVMEEIGDPLGHLLRNSIDHGIEPSIERLQRGKSAKGTVTLEAFHEENHIIISVRDDGRGIDPARIRASAVRKGLISEESARRMADAEVLNLVWQPGFSTVDMVTDVSGRGVGLDVVHKNIEKLNGSVMIHSEIGKGTEFRVKLPLTLAIIRSLQVEVLETMYCIPLSSVVETDRIAVAEIKSVRQREVIVKRGEVIPLLRLNDAFEFTRPEEWVEPDEIFVVIVSVMGKQVGLVVDGLVGEGDVVIKPLGKFIGDVPGVSGATIMGDGDVAIILDISSLINTVRMEINRNEALRG
jgi:two-component system chemotaxis sensor kinase CheA